MFSEAKVDVGAKIKEAVKRLLGTLVKVMKYVTGMIMKFLNWILGKKKNATNVTVNKENVKTAMGILADNSIKVETPNITPEDKKENTTEEKVKPAVIGEAEMTAILRTILSEDDAIIKIVDLILTDHQKDKFYDIVELGVFGYFIEDINHAIERTMVYLTKYLSDDNEKSEYLTDIVRMYNDHLDRMIPTRLHLKTSRGAIKILDENVFIELKGVNEDTIHGSILIFEKLNRKYPKFINDLSEISRDKFISDIIKNIKENINEDYAVNRAYIASLLQLNQGFISEDREVDLSKIIVPPINHFFDYKRTKSDDTWISDILNTIDSKSETSQNVADYTAANVTNINTLLSVFIANQAVLFYGETKIYADIVEKTIALIVATVRVLWLEEKK